MTASEFIHTLPESYQVLSERRTSGECGVFLKKETSHITGLPVDLSCEVVAYNGREYRVLTLPGESKTFSLDEVT